MFFNYLISENSASFKESIEEVASNNTAMTKLKSSKSVRPIVIYRTLDIVYGAISVFQLN